MVSALNPRFMKDIAQKILTAESAPSVIQALRENGKTIALCHGVFDLVHIGHLRHFKEAASLADVLIVSVTGDAWVNKGPNRPIFSESLRAENVATLEYVDFAIVNMAASAVPAIELIRPDLLVKGKDYRDRPEGLSGKLALEEEAVRKHGGRLVFTDDIQSSSTNLINTHFSPFPPEVKRYLEQFRAKHSLESVLDSFDRIKNLRVLVIGETIIDDYCYVEAIGKAGKEPVLVTRFCNQERFAGGCVAIANHVAGFCSHVGLLSCLGSIDSHEDFIRQRLKSNIETFFHIQEGCRTITKLRYLEQYLVQKLFEIYLIDDEEMTGPAEQAFFDLLAEKVKEYDVVVVADYGHGMLNKRAINFLCQHARFLAVNTQANAGNRGLHTITKYPRADYVSISEGELRLDVRRRDGNIEELVAQSKTKFDCPVITVTRGKHGIWCFSDNFGVSSGPGLTQSFVDRIGSGDAVLAVTSPLAAIGAHPDVLAFIGNLAGSEAVKVVGHRSSLDFAYLKKMITSLLK
jgi:cytidyltransferase-like protein